MKKVTTKTEIICDFCGAKVFKDQFVDELAKDEVVENEHLRKTDYIPKKFNIIKRFLQDGSVYQEINLTPNYDKYEPAGNGGFYPSRNEDIVDLCPKCETDLKVSSVDAILYQVLSKGILEKEYSYLSHDHSELEKIYRWEQANGRISNVLKYVQNEMNEYFEKTIRKSVKIYLFNEFSKWYDLEDWHAFYKTFEHDAFKLTKTNRKALIGIATKIYELFEHEVIEDFDFNKTEEKLFVRMWKAQDSCFYIRVLINVLKFYGADFSFWIPDYEEPSK